MRDKEVIECINVNCFKSKLFGYFESIFNGIIKVIKGRRYSI